MTPHAARWLSLHQAKKVSPRSCQYCHRAIIKPLTGHEWLWRSMSCTAPRGFPSNATENGTCCDFEREPGSDDDLTEA